MVHAGHEKCDQGCMDGAPSGRGRVGHLRASQEPQEIHPAAACYLLGRQGVPGLGLSRYPRPAGGRSDLREVLGLRKTLHFTTLCAASRRLLTQPRPDALLSATLALCNKVKLLPRRPPWRPSTPRAWRRGLSRRPSRTVAGGTTGTSHPHPQSHVLWRQRRLLYGA